MKSAPVIERAFAAGCVDISVRGDWEDVQVELGLARERITPKPDYLAESFGPGKLVDSSKYFIVAADALGNGVSSSPSR